MGRLVQRLVSNQSDQTNGGNNRLTKTPRGTGFGLRPSSNTGLEIEDAFVWVKPGGESDGTSDTSATRYDFHCGQSDSLKPAPEAGTWFEAYFEQLLTNANPAF